jgi:hypothetical protein
MIPKGRKVFSFPALRREQSRHMTIAIAAICDSSHETQTGNIILATDTLFSWDVTTSNVAGSKLYQLPHGFFMTVGDSVSKCHQFGSYLYGDFEAILSSDPQFLTCIRLAIDHAIEECTIFSRREVVHSFGLTIEEFLARKNVHEWDPLVQAIRECMAEIDVLICGFSPQGHPMVFQVRGPQVTEQANPGFACAGSGDAIALDWLNFRKQNGSLSAQRTYYHVVEALSHTKRSIAVGGECHLLLLRPGQEQKDVGARSPLIQNWFNCFYPKATDVLDSPQQRQEFADAFAINDLSPKP